VDSWRGEALIWIASICWSLESAIYCSAVWFPALLFFSCIGRSLNAAAEIRPHTIARNVVTVVLIPLIAIAGLTLVVSGIYRAMLGHFPDWMSYAEYALLYSGGFHSLPIDPTGSIWYLLIVFLAITTATGIYALRDSTNLRVYGTCERVGWRVGHQQLLRFAKSRRKSFEHRDISGLCDCDFAPRYCRSTVG
jgi:hypothetical protein